MSSALEQADIEFNRKETIRQQVQDADDLGHESFWLYLPWQPEYVSVMHAALREHGYRIRMSKGWMAWDGSPGQRYYIGR